MIKDQDWSQGAPRYGRQQASAAGQQPTAEPQSSSRLESLLHNLVSRLEENDRRYGAALEDLYQRLDSMSARAETARSHGTGETEALDRVEDQAARLARQVQQANEIHRQQQADETFHAIERRIREYAGAERPSEAPEPPQPAVEPAPANHHQDIDEKLAELTARFEQTLAAGQPTAGLEELNARMDDLARRFDAALKNRSEAAALRSIEAQLTSLTAQFGHARQQFARVDAIEGHLIQLMDWARLTESQVEAAARQAAEQAAHSAANDAGQQAVEAATRAAETAAQAAFRQVADQVTAHSAQSARDFARESAEAMAGQSVKFTERLDAMQRELEALNQRSNDIDARTVVTLQSMNATLQSLATQLSRPAPAEATPQRPLPSAPPRAPQPYDVRTPAPETAPPSFHQASHATEDETVRIYPGLQADDFNHGFEDEMAAGARALEEAMSQAHGPQRSPPAANFPDYHETPKSEAHRGGAPNRASDPAPSTGRPQRTVVEEDAEFLASARRAAQAAATNIPQPTAKKGLFDRLGGVRRPDAPPDDADRKKPRPVLVVAALVLLVTSAALLYGRLKVEPDPIAAPPERSISPSVAPHRSSQRQPDALLANTLKDDSKLHREAAPNRPSATAPLSVDPAKPAPDATARPKLASLPQLPVDPDYPGLAVTITDLQSTDPETRPTKTNLAPPEAPPTKSPAPNAEPAAPRSPMPPAAIGPHSLRLAAAHGNPLAQFEIAARFARGDGVQADNEKAAEWYARAAAQGLAPAQYRLAALHERGLGVKKDPALARIWYERAANQGNVKAMHNLGVIYGGGDGPSSNHAMAVQWFTQAARFGLADSQFNLGILYESGQGVKKDLLEAYQWYALAAARGDKEAEKRKQHVRLFLRPETVASADRTVSQWKPKPLDKEANDVTPPRNGWRSLAEAPSNQPDVPTKVVSRAQALLNKLGYDAGVPDGRFGPQTAAAIRRFETRSGLRATGELDADLVRRLEALTS